MTVDISVVSDTGLTLLVILVIGYFSNRFGLLDKVLTKRLSRFTMCIAQPCMLFTSITRVAYSRENLITGGWVLLLSFAVHVLMALFAFGAASLWRQPDERKLTEFSLLFVNCAFVGYPVLQAVFGDVGLFLGAFWVIMFNLIIWTWGMVILGRGRSNIRISFAKIFLNYGTVPCVVGLIFYALQLKLPSPLISGMTYVGNICTPVALLVIGSNLAQISLKGLLLDGRIYLFNFLRLLVMPMLVVTLCCVVGLSDQFCLLAAVMTALPTAANTVMFAEMYDMRPDLAVRTVGSAAFLSMFSIPVVVYLAGLIIRYIP